MLPPISNTDPLLDILRLLKEHGVPFVVIGGYAAVVHGSPLPTYDIDVCAPVDPVNASRIVEAVQSLNPKWRDRPDLPIVRPDDPNLQSIKNLYFVTSAGRLDVLGTVSGVGDFNAVVERSVRKTIEGIEYDFLNLDALIDAKKAAGRGKDLQAVLYLESVRDELRRQGKSA